MEDTLQIMQVTVRAEKSCPIGDGRRILIILGKSSKIGFVKVFEWTSLRFGRIPQTCLHGASLIEDEKQIKRIFKKIREKVRKFRHTVDFDHKRIKSLLSAYRASTVSTNQVRVRTRVRGST